AEESLEIALQWQREHEIVAEIKHLHSLVHTSKSNQDESQQLQKMIVHLKQIQGEKGLVYPFVDGHSIADVIANWTGIPVGKMLSDDVHNTLNLEKTLQGRVRGQDHALHLIAKRVVAA